MRGEGIGKREERRGETLMCDGTYRKVFANIHMYFKDLK